MQLSVIIPTYNRKQVLRHTVLSLINQGVEDYEIIVVDDGGEDNTQSEISSIKSQFKLPFELEYYYQERKGFRAGSARNLGVSKAKGRVIVFIDQDVLISPNVLKNFVYVNDGLFCSGIKKLVPLDFYKDRITDNDVLDNLKKFSEITFGQINATLSSFGAITRHDLELCEGFDEDFIGYGLEDTELIERLRDIKVHCSVNPRCVGYHIEHDYAPRVVSRQIQDIYHHKRNHKSGDGKKVSCE